jgi:hypothetical protein
MEPHKKERLLVAMVPRVGIYGDLAAWGSGEGIMGNKPGKSFPRKRREALALKIRARRFIPVGALVVVART